MPALGPANLEHTHQALICQCGTTLQVEQNGHIILVVCGVEASDVDKGVALAIPEILGVQGRPSVVLEPYCPVIASVFYPGDVVCCSWRTEREKCHQY